MLTRSLDHIIIRSQQKLRHKNRKRIFKNGKMSGKNEMLRARVDLNLSYAKTYVQNSIFPTISLRAVPLSNTQTKNSKFFLFWGGVDQSVHQAV
jgi:hypothetical protein